MQKLENPKEALLKHVTFLKKIYTLDDDCLPMPTNTLAIINNIKELLETAKTNSLLFAPIEVKLTALGYVLMLISHCIDMPSTTGFVLLDPQSQLWLAQGKNKDEMSDMERFATIVKEFLDAVKT